MQAAVCPQFGGVASLDSGCLAVGVDLRQFQSGRGHPRSIGVSMPRLEWRRRRLWKTSMYSKIAFASSTQVFQRRESRSSTCILDPNKLHHHVVKTVTNSSHRWQPPGLACPVAERPGGELTGCRGLNGSRSHESRRVARSPSRAPLRPAILALCVSIATALWPTWIPRTSRAVHTQSTGRAGEASRSYRSPPGRATGCRSAPDNR